MLDRLDTALYYPSRAHAYFFKGAHYLKWSPALGDVTFQGAPGLGPTPEGGVVPFAGSVRRRTGTDGWQSLPGSFRSGLNAAMYYPSRGAAYFFRGDQYVKYVPGSGVEPLSNGNTTRRLGVDGWTSLPPSFRRDLDAAFFYGSNNHAYFFKGEQYVKYRPGHGVVPLRGNPIRALGSDGWVGFPPHFMQGIDAALDYEPNGFVYFFRGREYLRWIPGEGVDERYPRRIGLIHGFNMVDGQWGGWPGLSHVLAGPMVGPVTSAAATIWVWLSDPTAVAGLHLHVNGNDQPFSRRDPIPPELRHAVEAIQPMSQIVELHLAHLAADADHEVSLLLDDVVLDTVSFRTAPLPGECGTARFVVGSCSDMSKKIEVPAFASMAECRADVALLLGDNCYYCGSDGTTNKNVGRPRDWESITRMFMRQLQARNHPQFGALARSTSLHATWDDHDFAFNNAGTEVRGDWWVGRDAASAVFRAMWPHSGSHGALNHKFRWGAVEVFFSDTRFHRDTPGEATDGAIWGAAQLEWLLGEMGRSTAPVKILITATQFLFSASSSWEGHPNQASTERQSILDAIVSGNIKPPVLILSGDVHLTELLRLPEQKRIDILEFTSSPLRRWDGPETPHAPANPDARVWVAKRDTFGVVTIDVQGVDRSGRVDGTITIEARNASGSVVVADGSPCRSIWNLAAGALT